MIERMGMATMRQLAAATGMEKEHVKDAIMRLDRSLKIIRAFNEREDWGTENYYSAYKPDPPVDDAVATLTKRAIRAYGPLPLAGMRFLVDAPLDVIEQAAADVGAVTISVGEGQTPMLVMKDEVPLIGKCKQEEPPVNLVSLSDPDIASKWAEVNARYGDRWIFPLVRGNTLVGGAELWEMSGCVEIRSLDMDSPDLIDEVLDAIDRAMGFFRMKGIDVVRIREVLNTDAADLEGHIEESLRDHGYIFTNGFYAKGDIIDWCIGEQDLIAYVMTKQRVSKNTRYATVQDVVSERGYIRGDQEIMTRVNDRTTMKKQMEKGGLVHMVLSPPFQGYTDMEHASIFRSEKGYAPEGEALEVLNIIRSRQPISKKSLIENSPYSADRTTDLLSELYKQSILYIDSDSNYCEVPRIDMGHWEAVKYVVKMHFRDFGIFSAEELSQFVSVKMGSLRTVLRDLVEEGFLVKGFFLKDDPTLRWMLKEDLGSKHWRFSESFVLNSQDNLHLYLRGYIKKEVGSSKSVIMMGTRVIGSFKGKVCASGAKVEEFEGSERAERVLKETAQSVGARLDTQRQREDDDWDVSEFYVKFNPGA